MEGVSGQSSPKIVPHTSHIVKSADGSNIQIMSDCEDGEQLSELSLLDVEDLSIRFFRQKLEYGWKECHWRRPDYREWSLGEEGTRFKDGCDRCGQLKSINVKLCTHFRCMDCDGRIQLCEQCHYHNVSTKVEDEIQFSQCFQFVTEEEGLCIFCKKNPLRSIKNAFERLFEAKRGYIVLKRFSMTVDYASSISPEQSAYLRDIFEFVTRLPTKPIVLLSDGLGSSYSTRTFLSSYTGSYGYISKLYFMTSANHNNGLFESTFNLDSMENTFVTDIGFVPGDLRSTVLSVRDLKDCDIIRPVDNVSIAEQIISIPRNQLSTTSITSNKLATEHAYRIRYNRDLVNNFHEICTTLALARKFPGKSKIIRGFDDYGFPVICDNPWGFINRDAFWMILSYLHPRDWEVTDKKKRKGRLTIKNPAYARNINKRHAQAIEVFEGPQTVQNQIAHLEDNVEYYDEQIAYYQQLKDQIPERRRVLEQERVEAEKRAAEETELFWTFAQNELDIADGKKKRPRKKRKSENDEDREDDREDDEDDEPTTVNPAPKRERADESEHKSDSEKRAKTETIILE